MKPGVLSSQSFIIKGNKYFLMNLETKDLEGDLLEKYAELTLDYDRMRDAPIPPVSKHHRIVMIKNPVDMERKSLRNVVVHNNNFIGYATLSYQTGKSNLQFLSVYNYFEEEYRDVELECEVWRRLLDQIPPQITTIEFFVRPEAKLDELSSHLISKGAKKTYLDRISGSIIKEFDPSQTQKMANTLREEALDGGFEIITVHQARFKEHPEIDYAEYLKMVEKIWNDMPREDSTWEDEIISEKLHQSFYKRIELLDLVVITYIAKHIESGKLAGYTETSFTKNQPHVAYQDDTGVLVEFRGNNLGLALKYQILARMLNFDPYRDVDYWITGNANSNAPMLRINDLLGYRELYIFDNYEMALDDFKTCVTIYSE